MRSLGTNFLKQVPTQFKVSVPQNVGMARGHYDSLIAIACVKLRMKQNQFYRLNDVVEQHQVAIGWDT